MNSFCIDNLYCEIENRYLQYRDILDHISNYMMASLCDYQVYITEYDIDEFKINFCHFNDNDKNLQIVVTKEQLKNIECVFNEIIIPELNKL